MDIVEELRQDREKGARRLEAEYKAGLLSLARRFCHDLGDAEELVNRTFAAVIDGIDDYIEQSAFFGWMCQILTNIHLMETRRKANRDTVYPGDVPDVADDAAHEAIYTNLDASLLRDAIKALPQEMKEVVVMHFLMEQPVARVAKFLSLPVSTVKWRLHVARGELARRLGAGVREAAKKPGGRAVLLALVLCCITALGSGVVAVANGWGEPSRRAAEVMAKRLGEDASPHQRLGEDASPHQRLGGGVVAVANGWGEPSRRAAEVMSKRLGGDASPYQRLGEDADSNRPQDKAAGGRIVDASLPDPSNPSDSPDSSGMTGLIGISGWTGDLQLSTLDLQPSAAGNFQLSTFQLSTTQGDTMKNTTTTRAAAMLAAASLATGAASAYETAITDTTGYVVQSAKDGYNENSIISGAHFPGGAPVEGKDYLVNNRLDTRTPPTANASNTFKGNSFTLDGGANFLLKGSGSTMTIANLVIYNALISQGDGGSAKTLAGGMTVKGTVSAPSILQGSANGGTRRLFVDSAISGDSAARIKVQRSTDPDDAASQQFYLHFRGDNSGYAGSIEVEGGGNGVCLVGYGNSSFGSSPDITLSQGGKIFGGGNGGSVSLSGASISLAGGGAMGVYKTGSASVGLSITGGSTISGTGTLTIQNSGFEGSHDRRVELANVAISGIDGIVANNILQLGSGYDNASVPITMAQPKMLRIVSGVKAGPVTLQGGSNTDTSSESASLASLTLETTSDGTPFIRKFLSGGLVTITGNIVNNLAAGENIRVDFTVLSISQLANAQSFRILSAANLGDAGVTAEDFVATAENTDESLRPFVTNGTFSIETAGNVKYLVYTLNNKVVVSTGVDASGTSSFNTGTKWNDARAPHDDADYFILGGHEVRSVNGVSADFKGKTLNVLGGGKFSVIGGNKSGVMATIGDFHLHGGATLIAKSHWGNNLAGAMTIFGSSGNPAIYETEWASGSPEPSGRWLTIHSDISGSGSLLCRYLDQGATTLGAPVAGLNLRGDNTGFTGEWQIMHPAAKATFTSAANFGSASALVLNSNGVFRAQGASFALPATADVVVKNVGSVAGSEDLTNGGTIEVDEGQTLTVNGVVSGAGILRKTGGGTLFLNAANTLTGALAVNAGFVGGSGSVGAVELADGAGFAVDAAQGTPFGIDALSVAGDIALIITGVENQSDRIAIASVGTLTGTLPAKPVSATIDGRASGSLALSLSGGVLYATRAPFVMVVR